MPTAEPSADRWEHYVIEALSGDDSLSSYDYETLSSGLAAVWARENTREGIFNAMHKKETDATRGTRIVVRFFGGCDYSEEGAYKPDSVSFGYDKGVPVGGDLEKRPAERKGPTLYGGSDERLLGG